MHLNPFTAAHPAGPLAPGHVNPLLGGYVFAPRPGVPFLGAGAGGDSSAVIAARVFGPKGGGGSLMDGDKGDITVSASGTVWNIDAGVVGATELADFSGFASAALSLAVSVPVYDPVAAANRQTSADRLVALQPTVPGGRLTLTTGVPVTAGDVTAATTIYYTPHHNDRITLEDGSRWVTIEFTEKSLAIGAVTADLPYDIFGVLSGGALAIEKLAWTNATTRATAITIQDGRYCKSGDKTRLYLGTICPYSTTQVADSALASTGGRGVWNAYNRVKRHLSAVDTTDSWNYTTTTWRSANASTANRVKFVRGLDEDAMSARVACQIANASTINAAVGVGVDSTSVNSAQVYVGVSVTSGVVRADYSGFPGAGFHFLQWLEISQATGSTTWFGDGGLSYQQAGLVAEGWF